MSSSPWPASVACAKRSAIAARDRQVGAVALGRLGHQARVLGRQRQRERGGEVLVEHELGLHAEVGQVQRAALERLEDPRRLESQRLGEGDRLGGALRHDQDPQVDRELQARRGARRPEAHRPLPDRVEERRAARRARRRARRRGPRACPPRPAAWCRAPARRRAWRRSPARAPRTARSPRSRWWTPATRSGPRRGSPAARRRAPRRRRRASSAPRRRPRRRPPGRRARRRRRRAAAPALSGLRFQARTSWPARARLRAMGRP